MYRVHGGKDEPQVGSANQPARVRVASRQIISCSCGHLAGACSVNLDEKLVILLASDHHYCWRSCQKSLLHSLVHVTSVCAVFHDKATKASDCQKASEP